jgi:hypothetical protein
MRAHGRCVLPEAQASKGTLSPSGHLAHPPQELGPHYFNSKTGSEVKWRLGNPRMLPSAELFLLGAGQIRIAEVGHSCRALKRSTFSMPSLH